ncbi:MAG: DUF4199 domain-containing protein [Bacteroidales bacterium]|nr:DUF4199 domain-containing protein [Candidatus Physcousia equi]
MELINFSELRNYSMKLGLAVSMTWIASFLVVVLTFPSAISQLGYLAGLLSICVVGRELRRCRNAKPMSFVACLWVSWLTFLCVVLLTTAVQWLYFACFDNGSFFGSLLTYLNSDEVRQVYHDPQGVAFLEQLQGLMVDIQSLSVKDLVMSFMSVNLILGLIFSLFSLLFLIGTTNTQRVEEN